MSDTIEVIAEVTSVIEVEGNSVIEVPSSVSSVIEVEGSSVLEVIDNNSVIEITQPSPLEITHEGVIGPEGPTGISEDEIMYAKRVDFVGDDLYRAEAAVGSLDSDPVWRIRFISFAVDGDVVETWAGGTAEFDKIWDDRVTEVYS